MIISKKRLSFIIFVLAIVLSIMVYLIAVIVKDNGEPQTNIQAQPYIYRPFSVNNNSDIAFVTNDPKGNKVIILYNQSDPRHSGIFPVDYDVADIDFSSDGNKIYFATNDVISNKKLKSTIYKIDINTGLQKKVIEVPAIIMDLEVDSTENRLLYSIANTFKDMGGITGKVRSHFEAYLLDLKNLSEKKISNFNGKEIHELSFNSFESGALLSIGNHLWEIPFDHNNDKKIKFTAQNNIFEIAVNRSLNGFIFSMPVKGNKGVYDYELYFKRSNNKKPTKITDYNHNVVHSVLLNNGELYYSVNIFFGKGSPFYEMYKISNLKTTKPLKVHIPDYKEINNLLN